MQHLLPDRSKLDLLYEIVLKLGIDPCVPIESRVSGKNTIYSVGAGTLFACLEPAIAIEDVEGIAHTIVQWRDDLNLAASPTCIFVDSAFDDDVAKLNLTAILEQQGLATIRSV